jgi:phytoene desaturase
MAKKIVIIGAGPGGLTAGMILAGRGFDVEIFEKESSVGGRNAAIKLGEYTFDTGPTFLMMSFIMEEVFRMAGREAKDYLECTSLDPMYRLKFSDIEVLPTSDHAKMRAQIARLFPGNEKGFDEFLKREGVRYEKMYPCLKVPYCTILSLFSVNLIKSLPYLGLGQSIMQNLAGYFTSEQLKLCFTFQSKYLGMSAWECPAAFSMIPYVEHERGIYHVTGGLNAISHAMSRVFKEHGGKLHLNAKVERIINEDGTAKGVVLAGGVEVRADVVIINADFAYAMANLTEDRLAKYTRARIDKMRYSCSTFMLYLGVDKVYDIPHHNIFFADDYRQNIEDIFHTGKLTDNMSFYIQNASRTDPTLAPKGHSAIYVLAPVANVSFGVDWAVEKDRYAEKLLAAIEARTELKDLSAHIKVKKVIAPDDWQNSYNVYKGATFNLSHNLGQMLYFRPHNKFESLENCYLVGGGTHPGSGLPTIYESGRLSSEMIINKYMTA